MNLEYQLSDSANHQQLRDSANHQQLSDSARHQQFIHSSDIQVQPANLTLQRSSDEQKDQNQSADFQLAHPPESQQHTVSGNINHQSYIHILPLTKPTAVISQNHQQNEMVHVDYTHNEAKSQERYPISQSQPPNREKDIVKENIPHEQAYKCTFCIKAFKQKSHLNHHVRVKHLKGEHLVRFLSSNV